MRHYLAGSIVLLLALLAVLLWLRGEAVAPPAIHPISQAAADAAAAQAELKLPATAAEPTPPADRQLVDVVAAPMATLHGRVVRAEDGAPLAGCAVRLRGHPQHADWLEQHLPLGDFFTFEPTDFGDAEPVRTGPDGTFAFTFAPPRGNWFELRFAADGRMPLQTRFEQLAPDASEDLGDVAMTRGCAVHGIVVDTKGEQQPGVELSLSRDWSPPFVRDARVQFATWAEITSGPAGVFAFTQAFLPGTWRLFARNRQKLEPFAVVIQKNQTDADVRVVVLRPEDVEFISGRVVDEQGAGITEAQVNTRMTTADPMWATIAADGSFRLERRVQDPRGPFDLTASAIGRESQKQGNLDWGARDVRFVLEQGTGVTLVVRDARTGLPVERFGVRNLARSVPVLEHRGRHERGELQLLGLSRRKYEVIVVPMQAGLLPSDVISLQVADGAPPRVEVLLQPPEARTVQVRRPDGSPVPGAKVELLQPGARPVITATLTTKLDASPGMHDLRVQARLLDEGQTAADGDATLQGPPEPPLSVRVSGPGCRPVVLADLRWQTDEGPLRVEVEAGATLTGQLRPEATIRDYWQEAGRGRAALDAAALQMWARLQAPRLELSRSVDGRGESYPPYALGRALVARDGSFTITGIPPGTWRVTLTHTIRSDSGPEQTRDQYLGTVPDLRDGETRRFDATLGRDLPAMLHGTVWIDGQPLPSGSIHLRGAGGDEKGVVTLKTNDRGEFDAQLDAGTWRMAVAAAAYGEQLPVAGEFTVEPGQELHKVFKLRTGQLQLRLVRSDGATPVAGVRVLVEFPGTRLWRWLPASDAAGGTKLDRLPLQTLHLYCRPAHLAGDEAWSAWQKAHADAWREVLLDVGEVDLRALAEVKELVVPATSGY